MISFDYFNLLFCVGPTIIKCVKCALLSSVFGIDTPYPKKSPSSGVVNAKIFDMSEQYALKYEYYINGIMFNIFYSLFSLLSHHFIVYSLLFSLILPWSPRHQTSSTHFNHSFFFSLLLLFSLLLSLAVPPPQPDADLCCCGFFFFFLAMI